MASNDDLPDVDFVLTDAPNDPAGRRRPAASNRATDPAEEGLRHGERSSVQRRSLVIGAVVLVGAALIGRALTSADHKAAVAATSSASPSSSQAVVTVPVPAPDQIVHIAPPTIGQTAQVLPSVIAPPACPEAGDGLSSCTTEKSVPAAFLAAVRARFPDVEPALQRTVRLRPAGAGEVHGLWSREFVGFLGAGGDAGVISVVVRATGDATHKRNGSTGDRNRTLLYSQHRVGGFTVEVQVSTPVGFDSEFSATDALARDVRLVALR